MFASVCIRRREDAPTLPPSDSRKPLLPKTPGQITARRFPPRTGIRPGFGRTLELIVTRITLLALFFVSVVGFTLDHARISLLLMSASALAIVLWNGLWKP